MTEMINMFNIYSGCPQLSSSNAVLVPAADAYHAPDIVNMTCAEGYYFIGSYASMASVILTCLETGRWDKRPLPECESKKNTNIVLVMSALAL